MFFPMTTPIPFRASALALCLLASACQSDPVVPAPAAQLTLPEHLTLGNPSGATTSEATPTNYLLNMPQYSLSYHRDQGKPNWVSWHLSSPWLGSAPRQDDFRPDPELPASWYHVSAGSYVGSGFDRGHNCPSADRTSSVADNSATFLMSNMMPQSANNNQRTWAGLEAYCRTLSDAGNELYIICGSYGTGGTGLNGYTTTIAGGKITVPSNCWKVVVVLPNGSGDVSRITSATRVIAINTPNNQTLATTWGSYRTTVDAIETATGYDILSAVPSSVQAVLEARIDSGPTN